MDTRQSPQIQSDQTRTADGILPGPVRIEAAGLVKVFGPTTALDGVDVRLHAGESVALMGPSGSGKSTLLHVLSGILTPDAGHVRWTGGGEHVEVSALGEDDRSALRRRDFGFVFQQGLLLPELTAEENVMLPLLLTGAGRDVARNRARRLLAGLGLTGREEDRPGALSGGQAQRVAVARAVATDAEVVFADEPTGALDSRTAAEVVDALLAATVGQGRTLAVVTHDDAVAARCSRTVRIRDGRVEPDPVTGTPLVEGRSGAAASGAPLPTRGGDR